MVFIIAWSKRCLKSCRLAAACVLCLFWAGDGLAAEVEIGTPRFVVVDDGYAVSADFNFELTPRLEEAVTKGVVLQFLVDFELSNPRWYWFDEKLVTRQMSLRLSYHALTRQYRLTSGGLHQSFQTLGEALRVLSRLRNWLVVEKTGESSPIRAGENYRGALRFRLDVSQLPRPFQISAVGSRDWHLSSDWKTWTITLPVEGK